MRNLLEYPITDREVIDFFQHKLVQREKLEARPTPDMEAMYLKVAINLLMERAEMVRMEKLR